MKPEDIQQLIANLTEAARLLEPFASVTPSLHAAREKVAASLALLDPDYSQPS